MASEADEIVRVFVIVTGRVQSVGFRYWARKCASGLGLVGWVRNSPEGDVEVMAQGRREMVDVFVKELSRGPSMARVKEVRVQYEAPFESQHEFEILE